MLFYQYVIYFKCVEFVDLGQSVLSAFDTFQSAWNTFQSTQDCVPSAWGTLLSALDISLSAQVSPKCNSNHHPINDSHVSGSKQGKSLYSESARALARVQIFLFWCQLPLSAKSSNKLDYSK